MDGLYLKAGIQGMKPPIPVAGGGVFDFLTNPTHVAASVGHSGNAISVEKPPQSQRTSPWGFSFRHPLRSLWPVGGKRFDAIAVDDAVSVEEKEEDKQVREDGKNAQNGSWVLKIRYMRSLWKDEQGRAGVNQALGEKDLVNGQEDKDQGMEFSSCGGEFDGCNLDDDKVEEEKIQFDMHSFSKLLKKVSLEETRLYAKMSYLGNLAYCIPQIKPENLFRYHGLHFVTSSLKKKDEALKADQEKSSAHAQGADKGPTEKMQNEKEKAIDSCISASAAYQISASAASYVQSDTKSTMGFKLSKPQTSEKSREGGSRSTVDANHVSKMNEDVVSSIATTDSLTAVVATKEEVKQAVANDLKSTHTSPCEWFICDDDQSTTRFFVIKGSETLASWQTNLLFEPIQFEGLDVLVHRGIYEAAKGIYKQMLPEAHAHLKSHGERAAFRFTGHSLGGSLSLLINLMLLIRGEVPPSSLLPVITFGAPSIMCGGDHLLRKLGLPRSHVQSITMHRDIVPRAFSCSYPNHVAELLKAVNANFRSHPCLNNQRLLYAPMGEFLILQPDEKFSPSHHLLPSGCGLYLLRYPAPDTANEEKQIRAAQAVFLNSPHPLEILSDRSSYGSGGTIQRDHDIKSYFKSVRNVIRQELNRMRKARREQRRRAWWPLVALDGINAGITMRRPAGTGSLGQSQLNFSGMLHNGRESLKRYSRHVTSQHMHLLVVLLFPARLLILGADDIINYL